VVNLSIQGPDLTIIDVTERLQAFQAKLPLWKRRLETDNFANFPMLEEMISQSRIDNTEALSLSQRGNVCENLDRLQQSFKSYCSDDMNFELWIRTPFLADLDAVCGDDLAKEDLIELRTMQMLGSDVNSKERSRILVFLDTSLSSPGNESHGCSYSFCYKLPLCVGIFGSSCYQNKEIGWTLRTTCVLPCVLPRVLPCVLPCVSKTIPQFHVLVEKKQQLRIEINS